MLRLVRNEARSPRSVPAAGYLLVGAASLAAGVWLGSVSVSHTPDSSTALYKRSTAFVRACETAGVEISRLRRAAIFVDDCSAPIVTPIFGEEGHLIVRRTVEGNAADDDGGRVTYSVKMDGRGVDKWRAIEIKRAPSRLTLDVSLLPTKASTAAER